MNKTKILLSTVLILGVFATAGYCAQSVNQLEQITNFNDTVLAPAKKEKTQFDTDKVYYPNASIKSATAKYKSGNYTGCLQELFSLLKKDPNNTYAYYYMALAYAKIGMQSEAVAAYEKVVELSPDSYIAEFAEKGKDCLTGGPKCKPVEEASEEAASEEDALDRFINAPYGNGLSPELNKEIKQKELSNIKETINSKDDLKYNDFQKIKNFDKKNEAELNDSQSYNDEEETIKIAQASDEDILNAVKTLKDAGVTVTVNTNPYGYQDPQMAEMSMMLGGNNNNNGSMMNMLPMLMAQNQEGKNIDPRMIQAMMMNSMMTDFTFNNNDNNRY